VPSALICALGLLLSTLPAQVAAVGGGPVIASGHLRDGSGHPLAGTVGIWYEDPLRSELVLLASAPTGEDGAFALRAKASGSLHRLAADNDGWVNLILAGGNQASQGSVAVARQLGAGAWSGPRGQLRADVVAKAPLSAAERAAAATFARAARSPASGASVRAASFYGCYPLAAGTWSGNTVIGEVHTWTDHTARWSYGKTADSDIGVGVSYNGTTWSESGSFHVGTSSSSVVSKRAGSRYGRLLLSRFEYRKLAWVGYCPFVPQATIVPGRWLSGLVEGASVRNYDGYCGSFYAANAAEFGPNTRWSRDRSEYATFNAAVSAFGLVSLSARSGLSTNVRMTHTFGSGSFHRLCGNDADILHATRVFAG
jgi:hypothetical protein